MKIYSALFIGMFFILTSCNNDAGKATEKPSAQAQELPDEKKAYYEENGYPEEDHSGHDHGGDTPKAIENNSRSSIPVERKTRTNFTESDNNPYKTKNQMRMDVEDQIKERVEMQKSSRKVPDACTLVTDKEIAKIIGVNHESIILKDGSNPASPYARSCFFRWDHRGVPNSGVLVQVQDNPVPNEFAEWASYYIQAKKSDGEKSPDGSLEFKYKDFADMGVDGAYCYDLHRYMWRDKQDFVYLIAFNLPASEAEEVEWAKKIGQLVMNRVQ